MPHGVMQWIQVLIEINDEELKAIAGTDAALYIIFNRYAAIFFFFITIFNFIVFLPIYVTGHPYDEKDVRDDHNDIIIIALFTSINIGGNYSR